MGRLLIFSGYHPLLRARLDVRSGRNVRDPCGPIARICHGPAERHAQINDDAYGHHHSAHSRPDDLCSSTGSARSSHWARLEGDVDRGLRERPSVTPRMRERDAVEHRVHRGKPKATGGGIKDTWLIGARDYGEGRLQLRNTVETTGCHHVRPHSQRGHQRHHASTAELGRSTPSPVASDMALCETSSTHQTTSLEEVLKRGRRSQPESRGDRRAHWLRAEPRVQVDGVLSGLEGRHISQPKSRKGAGRGVELTGRGRSFELSFRRR